jgi:hypothetical protein
VQQAVGKILRHGYDSVNPNVPTGLNNNRSDLVREVGDVLTVLGLLFEAKDLNEEAVAQRVISKTVKVRQYLHHA